MGLHFQVVSIVAAGAMLVVVLELVRRRRLQERYAILWLFSALVLLALALWNDLLRIAADAIGIFYPPSALFAITLGFTLFLLLHFSVAVSRLSDQSKVLAQRIAVLEERQREAEHDPAPAVADGTPELPNTSFPHADEHAAPLRRAL